MTSTIGAVGVAIIHGLAIAASSRHSDVSASCAGRSHRHVCFATTAACVSSLIRRATDRGRTTRRGNGHGKAATLSGRRRGGDDCGALWEETIVAMIDDDRAAFGITCWRREMYNGSRVVVLVDSIRRGSYVVGAGYRASPRAAPAACTADSEELSERTIVRSESFRGRAGYAHRI